MQGRIMIRRLVTSAIGFFLISLPGQVVNAQTSIVHNTRCTVADGYDMQDVLEAARSIDYDRPDGPNFVFFRQAITGSGSATQNGFIRAVRFENMEHWVRTMSTRTPSVEGLMLGQRVDCDFPNSWIALDHNADDAGNPYEGGELDGSLMYFRSCELRAGRSAQDFVDWLAERRVDGDRSIVQVSRRWLGPQEGASSSRIGLRVVGENPEGLARRLDRLAQQQMDPQRNPDWPIESCNQPTLMWSHVIHWSSPS
ncbi:MAG: hypothetical protein CME27_00575 [Gemmatimonadetes bacterium]|nr:hypothetical protein [Gemmatimonadota bacterium]